MAEVDWTGLLAAEDVEELWTSLFQLVSRHPAVRPLHFATDGAAVASQMEINADLTQELFLELFQKQRFEHYLDNSYTSVEIEAEISHIEIPNMVGARLRKRYPESFRMARRVSSLLKSSARFRRFGEDTAADTDDCSPTESQERPARRSRRSRKSSATTEKTRAAKKLSDDVSYEEDDNLLEEMIDSDEADLDALKKKSGAVVEPRRRRMVNQVFGLREWLASKPLADSGHFSDLIKSVPMRRRDTRLVGRSGSSQLILSNPNLEELIVEVLTAIDSPADVKTIRQLALAKIPLQDYNVASLDEEISAGNNGNSLRHEAADTRATPEDALLRNERHEKAARLADDFLVALRKAVNNNERRYTRLIGTLWHCYYNPQGPSQLEIARMLGVSDSLVSDNRRLIEYELKKLKLSVEDGAVFSESLQRLIAQADTLSLEAASK